MFTTCIYCHGPLGRNEEIEFFPVGQRLAFDGRRGRLWVVCRRCRQWNLTPLEERWEAVEECERRYRRAVRRASTDNIGLARLPSGLDLVRIGDPLRPEFAAWRYSTRLLTRRARSIAMTSAAGVGAAAGGAVLVAGAAATLAAVAVIPTVLFVGYEGIGALVRRLDDAEDDYVNERVVARIRASDGRFRDVRAKHLRRLEIVSGSVPGEWGLAYAHEAGADRVHGARAAQLAGQLLARVNAHGATRRQVNAAVDLVGTAGGPDGFIARAVALREARRRTGEIFRDYAIGALGLTSEESLALEMATQEDAERRALEGELRALEQAWRDAEEIAAISDALLLPAGVWEGLRRLRGRRSSAM